MQQERSALATKVETLKAEKENALTSLREHDTAVAKFRAESKVKMAAIEAKLDQVAVAKAQVEASNGDMLQIQGEEAIVKHEIAASEVEVFHQKHALEELEDVEHSHHGDKDAEHAHDSDEDATDIAAANQALGETQGKLYGLHNKNTDFIGIIEHIAETLGENNELLHKANEAKKTKEEDAAFEQKVKTEAVHGDHL